MLGQILRIGPLSDAMTSMTEMYKPSLTEHIQLGNSIVALSMFICKALLNCIDFTLLPMNGYSFLWNFWLSHRFNEFASHVIRPSEGGTWSIKGLIIEICRSRHGPAARCTSIGGHPIFGLLYDEKGSKTVPSEPNSQMTKSVAIDINDFQIHYHPSDFCSGHARRRLSPMYHMIRILQIAADSVERHGCPRIAYCLLFASMLSIIVVRFQSDVFNSFKAFNSPPKELKLNDYGLSRHRLYQIHEEYCKLESNINNRISSVFVGYIGLLDVKSQHRALKETSWLAAKGLHIPEIVKASINIQLSPAILRDIYLRLSSDWKLLLAAVKKIYEHIRYDRESNKSIKECVIEIYEFTTSSFVNGFDQAFETQTLKALHKLDNLMSEQLKARIISLEGEWEEHRSKSRKGGSALITKKRAKDEASILFGIPTDFQLYDLVDDPILRFITVIGEGGQIGAEILTTTILNTILTKNLLNYVLCKNRCDYTEWTVYGTKTIGAKGTKSGWNIVEEDEEKATSKATTTSESIVTVEDLVGMAFRKGHYVTHYNDDGSESESSSPKSETNYLNPKEIDPMNFRFDSLNYTMLHASHGRDWNFMHSEGTILRELICVLLFQMEFKDDQNIPGFPLLSFSRTDDNMYSASANTVWWGKSEWFDRNEKSLISLSHNIMSLGDFEIAAMVFELVLEIFPNRCLSSISFENDIRMVISLDTLKRWRTHLKTGERCQYPATPSKAPLLGTGDYTPSSHSGGGFKNNGRIMGSHKKSYQSSVLRSSPFTRGRLTARTPIKSRSLTPTSFRITTDDTINRIDKNKLSPMTSNFTKMKSSTSRPFLTQPANTPSALMTPRAKLSLPMNNNDTEFNIHAELYGALLGYFAAAFDRQSLVVIMLLMARDFRYYHSGLPDLILWREINESSSISNNQHNNNLSNNKWPLEVLLIEVKGPGDVLSEKQRYWLEVLSKANRINNTHGLMPYGVCHVVDVTDKNKAKK